MDIAHRAASFDVEEVSEIVKETIDRLIGGNTYEQDKVNQWTANIVDNILTSLTLSNKPLKYIVQAVIMQKNGAGIHIASSCFWDIATDESCMTRWENKHLYVIVSVFGLAM